LEKLKVDVWLSSKKVDVWQQLFHGSDGILNEVLAGEDFAAES
jgi:hypothetical protein